MIVSRQSELTKAPVVITVGKIQGGVRENIIPEELVMAGTIRTLDDAMQKDVHARVKQTAEKIAESMGATATVEIVTKTLVTYNSPELVKQMLPSLEKSVGKGNLMETEWVTGAEDFSYYRLKAPAFFFQVGGMPAGKAPSEAAPHHTPDFLIDDSRLDVGVKAFANLVLDFKLNTQTATNTSAVNFAEFSGEKISIENCREPNIYDTPLQTFNFSVLREEDLTARLCGKS
jgi:amidohydrolase